MQGRNTRRRLGRRAGWVLGIALGACTCDSAVAPASPPEVAKQAQGTDAAERFAQQRQRLVQHLREEGLVAGPVLEAIGRVERHRMVPPDMRAHAYDDRPLPIGHDQTISQPYVVALMTQLAEVEAGDKVLEIGTGSGYQAAVLAEVGASVFSVEIVEPLARRARRTLNAMGYGDRVDTRIGDGYAGWPDQAPFDAVILTAAPPEIPSPLIEQLTRGGKLVAPVGKPFQRLVVVTMTAEGPERRESVPVRFVPMTGKARE